MEKYATLNKWLSNMEGELSSSKLFNMDFSNNETIRIMEEDFIQLYDNILQGNSYKFINIEKSSSSESYDINQYRKSESYTGKELFTNLNSEEQHNALASLYNKSSFDLKHKSISNTYLCFGLLRYKLNIISSETCEAPLILVPVELTYNQENDTYGITGYKNEVLLNTPLIEKMQKERKLDLSYPINSNFSISNYLYYIGVKVKPLNWHVNNYITLTNINLTNYYSIKSIKENKEQITDQDFFKKIAYPNSEFYSFTSKVTNPLDSKFLSILEMENEEHNVLKKVINKEEMFVSTPNLSSQSHLITNIALSYILNNQKIVIVYSNNEQKDALKEEINNQGFGKYCVDLNPRYLNKYELLSDILDYDKYQIPFKSTKTTIVNENLNKYYSYKNNFKKLLNNLRTNKNHIGSSLNKVINEYYRLSSFPLINIEIKDANKYSKESLSHILTRIKVLSSSISNLNCELVDHPFYGLNRKQMYKEDYLPLKSSSISLTTYLDDAKSLFTYGAEKYKLPIPNSLKEFKALLNILAFANDYPYLEKWIDIEDLDKDYDTLEEVLEEINHLNGIHYNLVDKYSRKVSFLSPQIINNCYDIKKEKKAKRKVKRLLGGKILESDLDYIIDSLQDYYTRTQNAKDRVKDIEPTLVEFMHHNKLAKLREIINSINFYKNNLKYIQNKGSFNIHDHINKKEKDRLMLRRSLQTLFNDILHHQNILQSYFNNELIDFSTLPLDKFNDKVKQISKEFTRINDYTSYYIALHKVNELFPNLGNELIENGKNEDFEKIFLKRFYYDFLTSSLASNPVFKDYSKETIFNQLKNFSSTNVQRKEMINNILNNYVNNYLRKNMVSLKTQEAKPISHILKEGTKVLPLSKITSIAKNSLFNLKPCVLIPYEYVGQYLNDDIYSYDGLIYMSDETMVVNDSLASMHKGKTIMIINSKFTSTNPIKNLNSHSKDLYNFINNAKHAYHETKIALENKIVPLNGNFYDVSVKEYISKKLNDHGFESRIDRTLDGNTIDILARIPNTKNAVAIMVDHLPYNSPESAFINIEKENTAIRALGYEPYRIFPSTYFANEESEQQELNDFIVKVSKIIPEPKVKKNKKLLVDHLFEMYKDPHLVYYSLDKENLSLVDQIKEMITQCAPISIKELELIVKENTREIVSKLEKNKEIIIEDNFIYLPKQKVQFRRVNRSEDYYRPLEYVSNKELYDAIYQIVNYCNNIQKDTVIKMLLLSLGYKKINDFLYGYMESAIAFLLNRKVIFIEDDNILYKDLES